MLGSPFCWWQLLRGTDRARLCFRPVAGLYGLSSFHAFNRGQRVRCGIPASPVDGRGGGGLAVVFHPCSRRTDLLCCAAVAGAELEGRHLYMRQHRLEHHKTRLSAAAIHAMARGQLRHFRLGR
jgi:hypothetical protein